MSADRRPTPAISRPHVDELAGPTPPRRCGCESTACETTHHHDAGACPYVAAVPCDYIGAVCTPCALRMAASGGATFLHPDATVYVR